MAEIQLDEASANRFISSLSKSLQALCHGCMDFDAGIEIFGYINVNIDSGSKVQYVLNEQVLKSNTTNSMSFVSNSFLAKKVEQKTTRDGSCSPVPELNTLPPQPRNQGNYSNPNTQLYRSGIYSPHSQVVRGPQKRQWPSGDWRSSPRKFPRGARSHQYGAFHHPSAQQAQSDSSYSNQMASSPNPTATPPHSLPGSQQDYDGASSSATLQQSDINIKTEVEDNVGDASVPNQSASGAEAVNIKADPDAAGQEDSTVTPKTETDSFLQPSNVDNSSENANSSNVANYDESSNTGEYLDNPNFESQRQGGADAGYEDSGDMYPDDQSYAGEGTSGGGQFEVIEIDDEDEDVAAMFNDNQNVLSLDHGQKYASGVKNASPSHLNTLVYHVLHQFNRGQDVRCQFCSVMLDSKLVYTKHMNTYHFEQRALPYICELCRRGFLSNNGLRQHILTHQEPGFSCHVCDSKFSLKHNFKRHMIKTHGLSRH